MTSVLTLLAAITVGVVSGGTPASATTPTAPSSETARSLYMNNWTDTTGIWMAPKLAQTDTNTQYGKPMFTAHRR